MTAISVNYLKMYRTLPPACASGLIPVCSCKREVVGKVPKEGKWRAITGWPWCSHQPSVPGLLKVDVRTSCESQENTGRWLGPGNPRGWGVNHLLLPQKPCLPSYEVLQVAPWPGPAWPTGQLCFCLWCPSNLPLPSGFTCLAF